MMYITSAHDPEDLYPLPRCLTRQTSSGDVATGAGGNEKLDLVIFIHRGIQAKKGVDEMNGLN